MGTFISTPSFPSCIPNGIKKFQGWLCSCIVSFPNRFLSPLTSVFREVHIQDLIRAHEGNSDTHAGDASKIHWGKFNLIGKFIISTTQCQIQCRSAEEYHFPDRSDTIELLIRQPLMAEEVGGHISLNVLLMKLTSNL